MIESTFMKKLILIKQLDQVSTVSPQKVLRCIDDAFEP